MDYNSQDLLTDDWMQTYLGKQFFPLSPNADDICIGDIAHALSLQCRYGGHCKKFYSVAEHCVRVSRICSSANALEGLLHDAAEAYLQDMIRPLKCTKELGDPYRLAETALERVLAEKFKLKYPFPLEVKVADNVLLFTEQRDLLDHQLAWKGAENFTVLPDVIKPWTPQRAEMEFLNQFFILERTQ